MNFFEQFRIINFKTLGTRKFSHWIRLQDRRPSSMKKGVRGRKNFIKHIESMIGPLGSNWQYSKCSDDTYMLKLERDVDLTILLLKSP